MNKLEALIEEHKEMLEARKASIKRFWATRNKDRQLMRWLVEQAQFHKHMIVQVGSLNTPNNIHDFCGPIGR